MPIRGAACRSLAGRVRGVATAIRLGRTMTSHEVVITHIDTGRRLWIYREGLVHDGRGGAPRWFLHGNFA